MGRRADVAMPCPLSTIQPIFRPTNITWPPASPMFSAEGAPTIPLPRPTRSKSLDFLRLRRHPSPDGGRRGRHISRAPEASVNRAPGRRVNRDPGTSAHRAPGSSADMLGSNSNRCSSLERDDLSSNRHPALIYGLSMISSGSCSRAALANQRSPPPSLQGSGADRGGSFRSFLR
jgi:hypothetical protein